MDVVQYLWDGGRFVDFSGGVAGTQEEKGTKGVFLSPGEELRIFTRSLVYYLVPSMMSLPSLPCWSCSEFGSRPQQSGLQAPPATDLGSVWSPCASNLTSKGNVHIWPVISHSGRLHPAPDFEYLSEVVKVEKKKKKKLKGLLKTEQECAIKVIWIPLTGFFFFFFFNSLV